jgi:hypothetical protein
MAGLTVARSQAILDAEFVNTDYIAYSTNGSSEMASLARTSIGTWDASTSADPAVRDNTSALTSAGYAAAGPVTVTHFAIYSASTGGTQRTDWTTLTASRSLSLNDQLTHAAGAIAVTLT